MVQSRQEATEESNHDDKSLIAALVGDGRPLLIFIGLSLILSGGFALFLSINQQFLPHDVQFLGMTAEQLCGINNCRVVHFMFHDRVASWVDSTLVRGNLIAQLIDELPLLAVVGTQVPGGIVIRDAAELRRKESDRIDATVKNLRAMGAEVEEFEDGLAVHGRTQLRGAMLDSFGDHRIAMAFAVAALTAAGDSEIAGAQCVSVSFPEFFTLLESLVERQLAFPVRQNSVADPAVERSLRRAA